MTRKARHLLRARRTRKDRIRDAKAIAFIGSPEYPQMVEAMERAMRKFREVMERMVVSLCGVPATIVGCDRASGKDASVLAIAKDGETLHHVAEAEEMERIARETAERLDSGAFEHPEGKRGEEGGDSGGTGQPGPSRAREQTFCGPLPGAFRREGP